MAETLWIDRQAELDALCAELVERDWIAVDTEFLSDRSYFPRLCLVQIASRDVVACVDPLAPGLDLAPLAALLEAADVTKVFHSAVNDLPILARSLAAVADPLFDTQIAAALLGERVAVGYAALVEHRLGVEVDKAHQRTDWSRRPLPRAALRYAAADVAHLRDLYLLLRDELEARGRLAWAEEEFSRLVATAASPEDPGDAWRRVRGASKLDAAAWPVLRELARWREQVARATNRPRRWVLGDDALLEIARQRPGDAAELGRMRGYDARRSPAEQRALLAIVRHASTEPEMAPRPPASRPANAREASALERLREDIDRIAEANGLAPELLATSADLLDVLRGSGEPAVLRGWRKSLVGSLLAGRRRRG